MTQTNPEQWAVDLWDRADQAAADCAADEAGCPTTAAAIVIQAAFAEREARLVGALEEARTTISITRTNIMCEIGRCPDPSESRWEGVPEQLAKRIANIDAALKDRTHG